MATDGLFIWEAVEADMSNLSMGCAPSVPMANGAVNVGKVRARSDNGKLFLDFYYQEVRCREQTALGNMPANRRKVQKLLDRIETEIQAGCFDYGATFPGSTRAMQFTGVQPRVGGGRGKSLPSRSGPVRDVGRTPRFREFAEIWMREKEPEWRPSYQETVTLTLNRYLLPSFGNRRVGLITRADLLDFRARKGRTN